MELEIHRLDKQIKKLKSEVLMLLLGNVKFW